MEIEKVAAQEFIELENETSKDDAKSFGDKTEVKSITKRKKKVKRETESETDKLNGSANLNGSLTHPWSGRLEPMEVPQPYPGPYTTSLFWVRKGQQMLPTAWKGGDDSPVHSSSVLPTGAPATGARISSGQDAKPNTVNDHAIPSTSTAPWRIGKEKQGPATNVYLRMTFRKVGQIDTVRETFNADVIIQARWLLRDEDVEVKPDGTVQNQWSPKLYIENTNSNVIKVQHKEYWQDPDGGGDLYVIERMTARGTFTETMELDHFPFDCQNLTLTVASERSSAEISLSQDPLDPSRLHQGNFVDKQEWHLFEHVDTNNPDGDDTDLQPAALNRPALSFTCQASRRIGYFTWNVFLLLVVIFLMHMCSFSVVKADYNPRLGISFTMFLTAVAFKVALNQYLPRISYLTYMDSYILLQLVLMAFVCGWHATITHLPTAEDVAERTERIMIIIIFAVYIVFQVVYILIVYFIPGKRRRELRLKQKAYRRAFRKKPPMSSYT